MLFDYLGTYQLLMGLFQQNITLHYSFQSITAKYFVSIVNLMIPKIERWNLFKYKKMASTQGKSYKYLIYINKNNERSAVLNSKKIDSYISIMVVHKKTSYKTE